MQKLYIAAMETPGITLCKNINVVTMATCTSRRVLEEAVVYTVTRSYLFSDWMLLIQHVPVNGVAWWGLYQCPLQWGLTRTPVQTLPFSTLCVIDLCDQ